MFPRFGVDREDPDSRFSVLHFSSTRSARNAILSRLKLSNRDPLSDESIITDIRMDVKIQLTLEDLDSTYQLTFKNCSLTPEAVWIQPRYL